MFVGVDGYKKGWVAVAISSDGFIEASVFSDFAALMNELSAAKVIAVDMPLGLVEKGDRDADQAARDFLKGQSSSVFNSPPRPLLAAKDYEAANKISRRISGKAISKQTFNIVDKIIQVDAFATEEKLYEVHPEISFRLLNAAEPLRGRKKEWGGLQHRLELLKAAGIALPGDLGAANHVGIDDVVDAAAAAWSARRIAAGEARTFPEDARQCDKSGRRIAMWA
ncbi:MAG: putative RNase H-like nuclease [Polyangiales bacterium]|jgi:predicted RNase H-like nuclease